MACAVAGVAAWAVAGSGGRFAAESWVPDGAPSVRAEAVLASRFGVGDPQLVLIAAAPGSVDEPSAARAGRVLVAGLDADPRTEWVRGYWPARVPGLRAHDGHRALVLVRFRGGEHVAREAADEVAARYTGRKASTGPLRVAAGGRAVELSESERLSKYGLRLAEMVAAPLVLAVLLWVFGSVPAAVLPVLVGAFAVLTATALLRPLDFVVPASSFALSVATALGFGLAVDYSLLLVSRYREEAAVRVPARMVVAALRTAGRAVVVSAGTVAAALCTLLVIPLPMLRSLALAGGVVVVTAAVGALVVVPALLVLLGEHIDRWDVFARVRRARWRDPDSGEGRWARLARWVAERPVSITVAGCTLLVLLAAPSLQVRFGMYAHRTLPGSSPVAATARAWREDFGATAGAGGPGVVLPGLHGGMALDGYARTLSRVPGVARVDTVTGTYRSGAREAVPAERAALFDNGYGSRLEVLTRSYARDPLTPEGSELARRIRAVSAPVPAAVAGLGARLADTEQALTRRLPLAVGLACGAAFLLLLLYTRSLLVPVKALLLNGLSLAATFGILVAVFQQGLLPGVSGAGITDVLVPLMFAVAFGLSMDYEVFLLSRILEEHRRGAPTPVAVAAGLQRTGRLFTSAALVFAVSMSSLALAGLLHLRVVGVGLAVAVLLDCTLVRALLVPAVMRLAGPANWWLPGRRGCSASRRAVPNPPSQ
ncbi:MMPL family transporter [Streptomyces sp. AV19]|uniref:MMPL family transporter n=1 Tax=Streptomyces sp. AV19 TaxID=2793068 RepID=UPI0018FE9A04|nr:MMPL family transporter [Streptomyces sp. AV19]MBH1939163.1 MMPL family transporter [Streptomyces sp. AV19]MDG4536813.1 MMPL family transporter [Streptomyces sp. AV19]